MQYRTLQQVQGRPLKTSSIPMVLRRVREGVVIVQASNDVVRDAYGTIITIEGLHQWAEGYIQHRTVSQQHNLNMRGIQGKAQVGHGPRIDFTPQLEVEIRIDDPETQRLVDEGKLTGASLEFLPLPEGTEEREDGTLVYRQLSSEPEHCSLTLTDLPAVPGANILEIRGMLPNWAYAVVDPAVVNGQITDPQQIQALRYFPHHDPVTHLTDEQMLQRAMADIQAGNFTVPATSTLSKEQIIQRATSHMARHSSQALASRGNQKSSPKGEKSMKKRVQKWLEARAAQYVAQGDSQTEAEHKAKVDLEAQPTLRTQLEADDPGEATLEAGQGQVVVNVNLGQAQGTAPTAQPEQRSEPAPVAPVAPAPAAAPAAPAPTPEQIQEALNAHPAIRAIMAQPENPQAAMAGFFGRPRERMDVEKLGIEVLSRTFFKQLKGEMQASDVEYAHNLLRDHGFEDGLQMRALSVESNGTVIYGEFARQFFVKPQPSTIARNHFPIIPMPGVQKMSFPRFSGDSMDFAWDRASTAAVSTNVDPVLDDFDIEIATLDGSTPPIPDNFLRWNASGQAFVANYKLPEGRRMMQIKEDTAFFLSTGAAPYSTKFQGLRNKTGVTAVASSTNGNAFDLTILDSLIKAMPDRYWIDLTLMAFYLPRQRADDFRTIIANRQTQIGDSYLVAQNSQVDRITPGPMPIGYYAGIPVYSVSWLPTNETQGSANNASTIYLVRRDLLGIGDEMAIRIEPYREKGAMTTIQFFENVGFGYQWPDSIVRRSGVLPKV